MDKKSLPIYVIGSHGCSFEGLYDEEMTEYYPERNYFIVPENMTIIFFNSNAVESEGYKNIPFIKNLYDIQRDLFNYIIDPSNYEINLDKNNIRSYRNQSFFRSLPFFSNFNYLCNMEIYPAGVPCPLVHLSFTSPLASRKSHSFFEGITSLDNIIVTEFREKLNFVNDHEVYSPYEDLKKNDGWIYTNKLFQELLPENSINNGIFFISACRADFYRNVIRKKREIVPIHPIERNCGDITYDLSIIEKLKRENPESIKNIETVKTKIIRRNEIKLQIDEIIKKNYPQNTIFYNNNFLERLYTFISAEAGNLKCIVNFVKINIDCTLVNTEMETRLKLLDTKFNSFRSNLLKNPNEENNNMELYKKIGYLYRLYFYFLAKNGYYPNYEIYTDFLKIIDEQDVRRSNADIFTSINSVINPKYNFGIKGGNYKEKYCKYKQKYLLLKNKI